MTNNTSSKVEHESSTTTCKMIGTVCIKVDMTINSDTTFNYETKHNVSDYKGWLQAIREIPMAFGSGDITATININESEGTWLKTQLHDSRDIFIYNIIEIMDQLRNEHICNVISGWEDAESDEGWENAKFNQSETLRLNL